MVNELRQSAANAEQEDHAASAGVEGVELAVRPTRSVGGVDQIAVAADYISIANNDFRVDHLSGFKLHPCHLSLVGADSPDGGIGANMHPILRCKSA